MVDNDIGIRHLQVRLPTDAHKRLAQLREDRGFESLQQFAATILMEELSKNEGKEHDSLDPATWNTEEMEFARLVVAVLRMTKKELQQPANILHATLLGVMFSLKVHYPQLLSGLAKDASGNLS